MIETQVKSWGIKAIGKEIFTVQGEYSANMLREAILKEELDISKPAQAPGRPPILCPGCPHRGVYYVLNKLKIHAAGDIGCYTLGAVAPLSVVDTTICMGASISSLHGMEKAKGKEYIKNWVAVIGDSTFLHTGVNSLMNMMYNKATGTVIILDNSTTGMTGHQDHAATGKTLQGDPTYAIDIPALCRAIGVKNVVEVNARDIQAVEKAVKEEIAKDEVSVIITKTPCVLLDKSKKPLYQTHTDKCKKCGMCMKPGCPAMTKNADGTVSIDDTMCTGCGLCASLCKFDAIELVKEGGQIMAAKNIMIVGVGGQGTLLTSRILGGLAIAGGYDVKLSEVHGMAQRGGSVVTFVRYGDKVAEPIVEEGQADVIIAFERLEALRYAHFLKKDGALIINDWRIDPMPVVIGAAQYPENIIETLGEEHRVYTVNATEEAKKIGNPRVFNLIVLGVAAQHMDFYKRTVVRSD